MSNCAACGALQPDDGKFCPECGRPQLSGAPSRAPARGRRIAVGVLCLVAGMLYVLAARDSLEFGLRSQFARLLTHGLSVALLIAIGILAVADDTGRVGGSGMVVMVGIAYVGGESEVAGLLLDRGGDVGDLLDSGLVTVGLLAVAAALAVPELGRLARPSFTVATGFALAGGVCLAAVRFLPMFQFSPQPMWYQEWGVWFAGVSVGLLIRLGGIAVLLCCADRRVFRGGVAVLLANSVIATVYVIAETRFDRFGADFGLGTGSYVWMASAVVWFVALLASLAEPQQRHEQSTTPLLA